MVFFFAVLGALVGSFLNVVVLRHHTGKTLLGRSGCASCRETLHARDLLPIVSWVMLRGKCRHCGSAIARQYPLVEFFTAAAWGIAALAPLPVTAFVALLVLTALWMVIVVYDIHHTVIPDEWSYGAFFASVFYAVALFGYGSVPFIFYGVMATTVPLFLLWWGSSGRALGFGDVKLALSIGALLGPFMGFVAVMYGFVLGALFAVVVLLPSPRYRALYTALTKKRLRHVRAPFTMKSEVPFGPFLVLSAFLIWILITFDIHSPLIDAALLSWSSS